MFPQIAGARLSWAAVQQGSRPALLHGDQVLGFTDVEARTNRFANALLDLGVTKGERIAVLLNNCVDSAITVFGGNHGVCFRSYLGYLRHQRFLVFQVECHSYFSFKP